MNLHVRAVFHKAHEGGGLVLCQALNQLEGFVKCR